MTTRRQAAVALLALLALAGCRPSTGSAGAGVASAAASPAGTPVRSYATPPPMQIDPSKQYTATIQTAHGNIVIHLLPKIAPKTVNNFVFLATHHYYDGLTFHRVVKNFVIQGGDPMGDGSGGPGYEFADEPVTLPYKAGTVAMANAGPNTNGSQFFICLVDLPQLPPHYTIFGQTTSGMKVVRQIKVGDVMQRVTVSVH